MLLVSYTSMRVISNNPDVLNDEYLIPETMLLCPVGRLSVLAKNKEGPCTP